MSVALVIPETLGRFAKLPFIPVSFRQAGHHSRRDGTVVMQQERSPLVTAEVTVCDPVPVVRGFDAALNPKPLHVSSMVLSVGPEPSGTRRKQPLVPRVLRECLHDCRNRRTAPAMQERATAAIRLEIAGLDPVVIVENHVPERLPQPDQITSLVIGRRPETSGDWPFQPHRFSVGNFSGEWIDRLFSRVFRSPRAFV
jgi:hypothetical protein